MHSHFPDVAVHAESVVTHELMHRSELQAAMVELNHSLDFLG